MSMSARETFDFLNLNIHGVVQDTVHVVLIWAKTVWITVGHFSSDEDASGFTESGPERIVDMLDSIDTKAIDWNSVS
jgi:hypothetical protein